MTVQKMASGLLDFGRTELEADLRMVAHYSRDGYEPLFTSDTLRGQVDETTSGAFRYPFISINRATWQLATDNDRLDDPEVVVHSFGTVQIIQFPITEDEGVVLSYTGDRHTHTPFIAACHEIVMEHRQRQSEG